MHPHLLHIAKDLSPAQPAPRRQVQRPKIGTALRSGLQAALRRWKQRKAIAELERLSDHMLHDIGVPRDEIRAHLTKSEPPRSGAQPAAATPSLRRAPNSPHALAT